MHIRQGSRTFFFLVLSGVLLSVPIAAAAQGDGSMPPEKPADVTVVPDVRAEMATTSQSATTSEPTPTPPGSTGSSATSSPSTGETKPTPSSGVVPVTPAGTAPSSGGQLPIDATPTENVLPLDSSNGNSLLWPLLFALALVPFGFLAANMLKKKPKQTQESDRRCFDIESLLEKKLKELTDLRGMAEGKLKKVAKEELREAVKGTAAGDALIRLEKVEKEYNRLKKLYEECTIDAERYKYKGVLIENSLFDKSILEKLKVVQTRHSGDLTLHDIRLSKNQISDIQKYMTDEPWYFHLWEPGKNDLTIVFKNRVFSILYSDKATWADAIAYGKSIGIPEQLLDFRME